MSKNINEKFHSNSKISKKIITTKDFTYKEKLEIYENIVKNNKKIKTILDIGCGVGTIDFYLANKYNINIKAIDISSRAINIANADKKILNIKNIKFKKEDFTHYKKNKIKYDLIICNEVLEHLPNDIDALKIIYNLLKPRGILIISVPLITAPLNRLGLVKKFDKKVGHLRRYSKEAIVSLLKKQKFLISSVKETEGIIRNSLFTIDPFGKIIRFIKLFLISIIYFLDKISIKFFGASDITIIAKKI